jgi:hypothetical protein
VQKGIDLIKKDGHFEYYYFKLDRPVNSTIPIGVRTQVPYSIVY